MSDGGKIYGAMAAVMADVGSVGKDRKNPQQGYMFRGIDDVYQAVQLVMAKHGVFVVPFIVEREREERTSAKGGAMFSVRLLIDHHFYASDGSHVTARTLGEAMDSGDKSSNKAMSAAMKYALIESLCIPTEDANDTESDSPEVAPTERKPPVRAGAQGGPTGMVPGGPGSAGPAPVTPAPPPASARLSPVQVAAVRKALDGVIPVPKPAEPNAPENVEPIKRRISYVAWACGHWMETSLAELTAEQAKAVIAKASAGEMPPEKGKAA